MYQFHDVITFINLRLGLFLFGFIFVHPEICSSRHNSVHKPRLMLSTSVSCYSAFLADLVLGFCWSATWLQGCCFFKTPQSLQAAKKLCGKEEWKSLQILKSFQTSQLTGRHQPILWSTPLFRYLQNDQFCPLRDKKRLLIESDHVKQSIVGVQLHKGNPALDTQPRIIQST